MVLPVIEKTGFDFIKTEPIAKGWSEDKKYCVTQEDGTRYLLRISPAERYEKRKALFGMLEAAAALDLPMCRPVEFGACPAGVYSLQSWIDGVDAEDVIPLMSDTEQYVYGLKAGTLLKKIHSIPAPETQEPWNIRFNRKIDKKIQIYRQCPIQYDGGESFIAYLNANRHLLDGRPQSFQHGDYHIGNMMIENGELTIIDFDRFDFGDPWEEFNRIVWCAQKSPLFASGMINGYFDGRPPREFWPLLALYIASNTLSSVSWAIPFGQTEIDTMLNQAKEVLQWYDGMNRVIPTWYFPGYYLQYADGIPYKLKAPYDFSFLRKYGQVFKIFDDQDSGNLCFGTEKDGMRYFVKYAGAPAEQYGGTPENAVARLRATVAAYEDLRHPNLIEFVQAEEIGGGFAMVFKWADGACMGKMYPQSRQEFLRATQAEKLGIYRAILSFHEYVVKKGYVAVDFYDSSFLYDAAAQKTMICDIDFYAKMPYVNRQGRMWAARALCRRRNIGWAP